MFNNIRITFDVTKEKLRIAGKYNLPGTFNVSTQQMKEMKFLLFSKRVP
jgi:hypothetical protein